MATSAPCAPGGGNCISNDKRSRARIRAEANQQIDFHRSCMTCKLTSERESMSHTSIRTSWNVYGHWRFNLMRNSTGRHGLLGRDEHTNNGTYYYSNERQTYGKQNDQQTFFSCSIRRCCSNHSNGWTTGHDLRPVNGIQSFRKIGE